MVRKIVVANEKGGVGKTTTAVNLAYGLAHLKRQKVLLIDLDTQANATISLGFAPMAGSHALVMKQTALRNVLINARHNLDLVPSNHKLGLASFYLGGMEVHDAQEARNHLSDALKRSTGDYDFVIVDCGPGLDTITINALYFCREVLVPISLDFLSKVGTRPFIEAVADLQAVGKTARLRYVVPTFFQIRVGRTKKMLTSLQNIYGNLVTQPIRAVSAIAEAPEDGKTIFEYDPKSKGSQDYETLVRRVFNE